MHESCLLCKNAVKSSKCIDSPKTWIIYVTYFLVAMTICMVDRAKESPRYIVFCMHSWGLFPERIYICQQAVLTNTLLITCSCISSYCWYFVNHQNTRTVFIFGTLETSVKNIIRTRRTEGEQGPYHETWMVFEYMLHSSYFTLNGSYFIVHT